MDHPCLPLKQDKVDSSLRFTTNVSYFNVFALLANILFHLLHLLNTHITYDALAQDVSIASSQSKYIRLCKNAILVSN